jgi:prepilin-type N-terminal cleavage/methylation domain-containing protein
MKPISPAKRGMVLLEVLAALTLFAVVSLSLVIALNESMGAAKDRNLADAARRGLANQLSILRGAPLTPGEQDLPDDGSGFLYHCKIEPEPMQDQKKQPVLGIYRATITVKWKSEGHAEDRSVSELLYQP